MWQYTCLRCLTYTTYIVPFISSWLFFSVFNSLFLSQLLDSTSLFSATTFEVLGKGKEIVTCFSTFEIGSTSATRTEHDAFGATITITEMPHQAKTDDTSQLMSGKANNLVGCFSTFQVVM
ncbi:uncharacterized protein LOC107877062 [Capsicum annuum]|uniref:uncharacterized protein LOC107877062 n=1 Tax=Capsicum annuum TaxID=4072 RepID=UPI001FB0DFAD|nr:uncharacterized protein LOC107877062 [Capsicum annuum]